MLMTHHILRTQQRKVASEIINSLHAMILSAFTYLAVSPTDFNENYFQVNVLGLESNIISTEK